MAEYLSLDERAPYIDKLLVEIDRIAPPAVKDKLGSLVMLATGRRTTVVVQMRIEVPDPSWTTPIEQALLSAAQTFGTNLDIQSFVEKPKK